MKTLTSFIAEAKAPLKGESTWKKVFDILLDLDELHPAQKEYFDEVQEDDWIWDGMTGEVAEVDLLYKLYKNSGDVKVYWEYNPNDNEYIVSDDDDNSIYFMVTKPYENGL